MTTDNVCTLLIGWWYLRFGVFGQHRDFVRVFYAAVVVARPAFDTLNISLNICLRRYIEPYIRTVGTRVRHRRARVSVSTVERVEHGELIFEGWA
jgi:hypothetical protein